MATTASRQRYDNFQLLNDILKLEPFIHQAYSYDSAYNSLYLILSSGNGRKYFESFLEGVPEFKSCLWFWLEAKFLGSQIIVPESIYEKGKSIYHRYLDKDAEFYVNISQKAREKIGGAFSVPAEPASNAADLRDSDIVDALSFASAEVFHYLAFVMFPKFMRSNFYARWRRCERGHSLAVALSFALYNGIGMMEHSQPPYSLIVTPCIEVEASEKEEGSNLYMTPLYMNRQTTRSPPIPIFDETTRNSESVSLNVGRILSNNTRKDVPQTDYWFSSAAFASMRNNHLKELVFSDSRWLLMFISALEGVPLAVSLHAPPPQSDDSSLFKKLFRTFRSKVSNSREFCPFLYANPYFEALAGISRSDLCEKSIESIFLDDELSLISPSNSDGVGKSQKTKRHALSYASHIDHLKLVRENMKNGKSIVLPLILKQKILNKRNNQFENCTIILGVRPIFCAGKTSIAYYISCALKYQAGTYINLSNSITEMTSTRASNPDSESVPVYSSSLLSPFKLQCEYVSNLLSLLPASVNTTPFN